LQRNLLKGTSETDSRRQTSDKLNVDYTRVFGGEWLSVKGLEFEQKIVEYLHAVLVEEPLVIE
jgi:hypothetical protein